MTAANARNIAAALESSGDDVRIMEAKNAGKLLYETPDKPTPHALIGPTGYDSYGVVWRNAPALEARGGYSGPFKTYDQAAERAVDLAAHFEGVIPAISRVENVNKLCKYCTNQRLAIGPHGCGRSECQDQKDKDNAAANGTWHGAIAPRHHNWK